MNALRAIATGIEGEWGGGRERGDPEYHPAAEFLQGLADRIAALLPPRTLDTSRPGA